MIFDKRDATLQPPEHNIQTIEPSKIALNECYYIKLDRKGKTRSPRRVLGWRVLRWQRCGSILDRFGERGELFFANVEKDHDDDDPKKEHFSGAESICNAHDKYCLEH